MLKCAHKIKIEISIVWCNGDTAISNAPVPIWWILKFSAAAEEKLLNCKFPRENCFSDDFEI